MYQISLLIGLIFFAFIVNRLGGSEIVVTVLVLAIVFLCALHIYYNNTTSDAKDLYNEDTKKIKKKQQLNDTLDALLNKNTSSAE